jgi:hypothetical protein
MMPLDSAQMAPSKTAVKSWYAASPENITYAASTKYICIYIIINNCPQPRIRKFKQCGDINLQTKLHSILQRPRVCAHRHLLCPDNLKICRLRNLDRGSSSGESASFQRLPPLHRASPTARVCHRVLLFRGHNGPIFVSIFH